VAAPSTDVLRIGHSLVGVHIVSHERPERT
jgi:hypothetical protein